MFTIDPAKIVVTGGTGFLGRHLTDELRAASADVAAVGSGDYDLRDRRDIDRMLEVEQPNAVVHLAATVGGIGANRAEPGRFFYDNIMMGVELLESCRRAGVPKMLVAGTVCSYPKVLDVPFREEDLWNGYPEETNAPYGIAKKALLVQAQAYREQYGSNIVFLLPVNLYGPGDNFDLESGHVIPSMIRKFVHARRYEQHEVVLWGDGTPTREFLHVADAARGLRLALERYNGAEPVNLGSGDEISIRDLAALIREATGYQGDVRWDATKPNGQPRRRLDTSRAEERFGFCASRSLNDGIAETVAWYLGEYPTG